LANHSTVENRYQKKHFAIFTRDQYLCMANYQLRGDYGLNLFSTVPFAGALLGFRVVDR